MVFFEIPCLATSEREHNVSLRAAMDGTGTITTLEVGANNVRFQGEFSCEVIRITFLPSGSTVTQLNSTSRLVVRLI